MTPVAAGAGSGLTRRRSSRSAASTDSAASGSASSTAKSREDEAGLRKQVAILFLREVGGLTALAADYGVTKQSCSYYVTRYATKMPTEEVVLAVLAAHSLRVAAAEKTFMKEQGAASSAPARDLRPTPERRAAAFRIARGLGRKGELSREKIAAKCKEDFNLKTFSTGTVRHVRGWRRRGACG